MRNRGSGIKGHGWLAASAAAFLLAACGSQPPRPLDRAESPDGVATKPPPPKPGYPLKRGGGYYQDDGPGENAPENLDAIPDAEPKVEALHRFANNPYSVLGRDYTPMKELRPYKARGIGSWYGRKFHGQRTSIGEAYDMYAMTAAHPTLPVPSYARVTNLGNGKSVVVRVNDRGPFLHGRLIDLSYAAANRLGYAAAGSAPVEVELILPGSETMLASARTAAPPPERAAPAPAPANGTDRDPIAEIAAAQEVEPPRPVPTVAEGRGLFLQLAAFSSNDNAESFRARIAPQLADLADKLHIYVKNGTYRLHVGPYRDAQEAGRIARFIRESLELSPLVIRR